MAADSSVMPAGLLLAVVLLISFLPVSNASPYYSKFRLSASEVTELEAAAPPPPPPPEDQPTTFFEVDRPHRPPPGSFGPCSTLLLSHSFAYTYQKPPVTVPYSPPACLAVHPSPAIISLAVLEWRATCRGVQFDRVFGVWLGGVELLRGSTAEPRPNGVAWSVSKDVTKYASLLAARTTSTLAVYLGNVVDDQYTGVFHANLTLHLYFHHHPQPSPSPPGLGPADVILPVSRSLPLNDGQWFPITDELDVASASVAVPRNAYRAVLEVYLSYHSADEFWYANTPDQNGPFREVVVTLDGDLLVGAVWPFPVVYTGGIYPLLWRPVSGIGSFSLPSYDIELTPFLGKLLDGEQHEFGFAVTGAQNAWLLDANLHLWVDPKKTPASAGITSHDAPPLDRTIASGATAPGDELYYSTLFRRVYASGWVETASYGRMTATWTQRLGYENTNAVQGSFQQAVNQSTDAYAGVHVAYGEDGTVYAQEAQQGFELGMFVGVVNQRAAEGSYTVARRVRLGFAEDRVAAGRAGFWARSLRNAQECEMDVDVDDDGRTVRVAWGTRQTYDYEASDACYFRNVTSRGYNVVFDHSDEACARQGIIIG
ncbi:hypothetical protein QOZ80_1AG0002390 [Eleusine coracana subsp. coracana]|nr:hypothetical protein QOZ80_1AG0002390 [Eleusine coracana subsp. coracana]